MDVDIIELVRNVAIEADVQNMGSESLADEVESAIRDEESSEILDVLVSVLKYSESKFRFLVTVYWTQEQQEHYAGSLEVTESGYDVQIRESYKNR